jgi:hypothetical protein
MTEGIEGEPRASFPAGARCAHHPDRAAERTCVRCGNYMCRECVGRDVAHGAGLCLACANRQGASGAFPFDRESYTIDGLLNLSIARWKENWLGLALAVVVFGIAVYLPPVVFTLVFGDRSLLDSLPQQVASGTPLFSAAHVALPLIQQLLVILTQATANLVLFGYALDILERKDASAARALERLRALPQQLLVIALIYAAIGLGGGVVVATFFIAGGMAGGAMSFLIAAGVTLLLMPAFVYVTIGLSFVTLELAHVPGTSAGRALRVSWELAAHRRWRVAGVMFVSGLIGGVGLIACCVGVVVSFPIGTLVFTGLYLALKQTPLMAAVVSEPPI